MVLVTFSELRDVIIMTLAVGYIFMDFFRMKRHIIPQGFDWRLLWFACLVTAPAIIFHELAHKFTAILSGLQASFHAAYFFLGIGVLLKLVHSPFIFFVPGYVTIDCASPPCTTDPAIFAGVAFAGPALNLILFLVSWAILKFHDVRSKKWYLFLFITQRINLLLFILNMLPIPGFDGFKFYQSIWQAFF